MKKDFLFSLLFFLLLARFVEAQIPALGPEEAAVKAVIERETEMFFAGDLEKWSATRTHTENILTLGHEPGNTTITRGWQKQLAAVSGIKDFAKGAKMQVERTNWNIRVSGNVAWATFDQTLSIPQFGLKNGRSTEIRCLEKTSGQWTISVLSYTATQPSDTTEVWEAIKKVLREETQAYMDADIAKWTALHSHDENETAIWNNGDGTYGGFIGWSALALWAIEDFSKRGKYTDKLAYDHYKFTIRGNMAFVAYDQTATAADGKVTKSREHRVLVRQDGQWKILACLIFFNPEGEKK